MNLLKIALLCVLTFSAVVFGSEGIIEEQLKEIGSVPNQEVMVVQRKYTTKQWRHEFTPVQFGGIPFGTVRRTLFGGASYTLHANDWLGFELINFIYTKTFFSSFTDDINNHKDPARNQLDIKPDYQKLLYFVTTGVQITPIYGKLSTLSRWIAYMEPYFSLGVGFAKTETNQYMAFSPGIGMRVFFREWVSMRVDFRNYLYTETFETRTAARTETSQLRNNYAVMLSLSFWLPKMPG